MIFLVLPVVSSIPLFSLVGVDDITYTYKYNYNSEFQYYQKEKPFKIGRELQFYSGDLKFICSNQVYAGYHSLREFDNSCSYTEFDYDGNIDGGSNTLYNGDERILDEILKVRYTNTGNVFRGLFTPKGATEAVMIKGTFKRPSDWSNIYSFEFINKEWLKAEYIPQRTLFTLNQEDASIKIKVTNDFNSFDGGIFVREIYKMLYSEDNYDINKIIEGGETFIELSPKTDALGVYELSILPFVYFSEDNPIKIFDDREVKINYKVVPNIDIEVDTSIECNVDSDCRDGFYCESYGDVDICENERFKLKDEVIDGNVYIEKKDNTLLYIIIAVIVIGGIIYVRRR